MGNFKGWAKYARTILALSWLLIFWKGGIIGCAGGEEEVAKAIHAVLADSDSDGLADQDEIVFFHTDSAQYDMDGDGLSDGQEICYDNNCLDYTDGQDTNPNNPDTDGDSYWDGWEVQYGFDPLSASSPAIDDDSDQDGIPNSFESNVYGTDPNSADSDGDGYPDKFELDNWSDPTDYESIPSLTKVVINEFFTGTCTWIELYNVGSPPVDLGNWTLRVDQGSGLTDMRISDLWGNFTVGPREFVTLDTGSGSSTATHRYSGSCSTYCDEFGSFGSLTLIDNGGTAVDYVRWGGHWPATVPPAWGNWNETGPIYYGCPAGDSMQRDYWGKDTDNASDWSVDFASPGEPNTPDSDGDGLSDWAESNIYDSESNYFDTDWDGYSDMLEVKEGTDPEDDSDYPSGIIPEQEVNDDYSSATAVGDFNKPVFGQLGRPYTDPFPKFFDDFADGLFTDTFQNYSGTGATVMAMGNHGTALCGGSASNNLHLYTQNHSFGDAILEFDHYISSPSFDGGVFIRVQDSNNGYRIALRPPSTGHGWNVYTRYNGNWYDMTINDKSSLSLTLNQWFHYKIIMEGNRFTIYENGNYRGYFVDQGNSWSFFAHGGVGLQTVSSGGGKSCFDNIKITPITPEFSEDFSEGVYTNNFQYYSGGNRDVYSTGGHDTALCASDYANNIHLYTQQSFGDGTFEFDYYLQGTANDGGVFLRVQDYNRGLLISLDRHAWQAYLRVAGNWYGIAISNYSALTIGNINWHHFKVFMNGGQFDLFEEGNYRGTFYDSNYMHGAIGLRGVDNSSNRSCIDNIRVVPAIYDTDFYSFNASAGQFLDFDIDANELGSPVDTILKLYDTDGTTLLNRNDDGTDPETSWDRLDSYFPYYFTAGGNFYLSVQGSGWGREALHSYELRVTDVTTGDADGDGLSNSDELTVFFTDPLNADSDGDGLSDYFEINYDGDDTAYTLGADTDPNNPNTDGTDGSDGEEVANGTDPLDPLDPPFVLFSQFFSMTGGEHCASWNTFRSLLVGTYSLIKISGTYDPVGQSCIGPTANLICQALRTGASGSWFCDGRTWTTGDCCGGELTTEVYCNCGANYAIRPCCWAEGGMGNSGSCYAPTQTMSVWCSG